jgi:DNA (cytosine-5)-methyltransferase 1
MAKTLPVPIIKSPELPELLERIGMNCQEASEKFGISKRTMYRWMKGESISPAYSLVVKDVREMIRLASTNTTIPMVNENFTYIDLFAGIGGFRRAFDQIGGTCAFTSEWDKSCRITYQANNDCNHPVVGDIREFTKDKESLSLIPKHDLLVAGFPCQPFSIAGVSKKNSMGRTHGFQCDTQGTLFFDLAQIIEHHRPPVILLENVKNLLSHDGKNTFKIIKRTLEEELKYKISFRVIDGRSWVPQHRERIFIVGFREDVDFDFKNFTIPEPKTGPRLSSILHKLDGTEENEPPFMINGEVNPKYTLSPRLWDYLREYKEKHQAKGNGFGFSLFEGSDVARTLSARYYKDGSEILIKQEAERRPRRLTPRECSRLMGFDGPGENNFIIPVSDTQAYRQFGNSVIVPQAKSIANFLRPYLLKAIQMNNRQMELAFNQSTKVGNG